MCASDNGAINLLRKMFENLFVEIENKNKIDNAKWLENTINWAKKPKNLWIDHFSAIFNYDSVVMKNAIVSKCQVKLGDSPNYEQDTNTLSTAVNCKGVIE